MYNAVRHPADECVLRSTPCPPVIERRAGPWVLAATILGSSMSFIDGTVVNVALPVLQRDFGASAGDALWVVEAYSLFLSALILVGGSLGDIFGRRRIFALGIAIFTAASAVCGLAPNIGVLIGARALQGIGGALLVPGSLAIISASFAQEERGKAIGTWAGFTTITSAVGPVLGGGLVQFASWRWVFFINLPLAALTLVIVFRCVPESWNEDIGHRVDWLGGLLATLGLGGIVFALIEAGTRGLGDPLVLGTLLGGCGLLICFGLVERGSRAPMMPLDIFRSRTFTGANLLTFLLYGGLGGSLYFVPFVLQQVHRYTPAEAGAALLPFTVIVFSLSRWTGDLVRRYGARRPLVIGPLLAAAGFLLYSVPGTGGSYWTTFFPAVVVMALGMALVIAPLSTSVMNAVQGHRSGVASGVNNAVSRTSGLLAIAVLGLLVVTVFDTRFDSRLSSIPLSAQARTYMEGQRSHLAAAQIPASIGRRQRAQLRAAIDDSFVAGFRAAMWVAVALGLLSALAAFWLLGDNPTGPELAGVGAPLTPRPSRPLRAERELP
jgi:EmrB/QacA subfamily drug resistance transporter